jgi:hypothetical protein
MMNSRTPTIHRNHIELRPLYGYGIWRGLRFRIDHSDGENTEEFADDDVPVEHFQMLFQEFGYDIEGEKIIEWLESDASDSGVQVYTEAEICEMVSRSCELEDDDKDEEEEQEEEKCLVSNSDAT